MESEKFVTSMDVMSIVRKYPRATSTLSKPEVSECVIVESQLPAGDQICSAGTGLFRGRYRFLSPAEDPLHSVGKVGTGYTSPRLGG